VTDTVATVEANANSGAIESAIQTWLTNNNVTSVDDTESVKIGRDRVVVIIMYTA
jgi:hypothetical protein